MANQLTQNLTTWKKVVVEERRLERLKAPTQAQQLLSEVGQLASGIGWVLLVVLVLAIAAFVLLGIGGLLIFGIRQLF